MRMKLILISLLLLLCCVIGCDSALDFPQGINGVTILEKGGGNINPPPPITDDPLAGAIIAAQPQGAAQGTVTQISDSKGGFRLELPPGTYTVTAQAPPDQPFLLAPEQQTIVVLPHRLSHIVITFTTVSRF